MQHAHHEIHFENHIAAQLQAQGWLLGESRHYDVVRALYPEDVLAWVQASQPQVWEKLCAQHGARADLTKSALLERLVKQLEDAKAGTLKVLRDGITMVGLGTIQMSARAPEDGRNPLLNEQYAANRLRVVRQLRYSQSRDWEIDLVLFVNGLPVATVELKTEYTQGVEEAKAQYRQDRLPVDPKTRAKEPLLSYQRGALVHFAMSEREIAMTTHLKGADTYFLPFNAGNNGHAGNAPREDDYPTAYFWQEVCQRDAFLRVFHNFMYVEVSEKPDATGRLLKNEVLIFPRYHQWRAVNRMIADARAHGAGKNYLCEHSAGSGKTSTIAWLAHDLVALRTADGVSQFDKVVIVTDRRVLDRQLQDAIKQLDHQFGMIKTINDQGSLSKSQQLAQALGDPAVRIIVVTIQTFPWAFEQMAQGGQFAQLRYGVIIDEAHNSQTGSAAQGIKTVLSLDMQEDLQTCSIDEVLKAAQKARVMPDNISHFAFTATPKHTTYTLFGQPKNPLEPISNDNKPVAFDVYSQRQAIEEGFILDVLQNYVRYELIYKLNSESVNDQRVDKKYAKRALSRWLSLHPTMVGQKTQFIMEHFTRNVAHLLGGQAKAMVVANSRAQAVKYKLAFDAYIKNHDLNHFRALVAFSGDVNGRDVGYGLTNDPDLAGFTVDFDQEYNEHNLNPDIGSQDLKDVFEGHDYKIMLVANKFQTGFNQPKLVAMYLDKKISGVEAVQTLSRLNRTYAGKDKTYVIDFANDVGVILSAFTQYDQGAQIEEVQDLNVVYDAKSQLDESDIYQIDDLEKFKALREKAVFSFGTKNDDQLHKKLYLAVNRPAEVFNSRLSELKNQAMLWEKAYQNAYEQGDKVAMQNAEVKRSEFTQAREGLMLFKTRLARFVKIYQYIAQLIYLEDAELENFATFASLLSKRLDGIGVEQIDLSGLVLSARPVVKPQDDDSSGTPTPLAPLVVKDGEPSDRERDFLKQIIDRINDLFGDVTDADGRLMFTAQVLREVYKNETVVEQVLNNDLSLVMQGDLPAEVTKSVAKAQVSHERLSRLLRTNRDTMNAFQTIVADMIKAGYKTEIFGSVDS